MDYLEQATNNYLVSLALGCVEFEPFGKQTFPDFSVGGRIGVECTRLVHTVRKNGVDYDLNAVERQIGDSLGGVMANIPRGNLTGSYFVNLDFAVDLELRSAKKDLRNYLSALNQLSSIVPHRHEFSDKFKIGFLMASKSFDTPFLLGSMHTPDSASWVLEQLCLQTKHAIDRKTINLQKHQNKFDEWWLAVGGDVTGSLSESYYAFISNELRGSTLWKRVLLIDIYKNEKSRLIKV